MKMIDIGVLLAVGGAVGVFFSLDRIELTVYEIETKDGKTLKLACPTVDAELSTLTYVIEGECIVFK